MNLNQNLNHYLDCQNTYRETSLQSDPVSKPQIQHRPWQWISLNQLDIFHSFNTDPQSQNQVLLRSLIILVLDWILKPRRHLIILPLKYFITSKTLQGSLNIFPNMSHWFWNLDSLKPQSNPKEIPNLKHLKDVSTWLLTMPLQIAVSPMLNYRRTPTPL